MGEKRTLPLSCAVWATTRRCRSKGKEGERERGDGYSSEDSEDSLVSSSSSSTSSSDQPDSPVALRVKRQPAKRTKVLLSQSSTATATRDAESEGEQKAVEAAESSDEEQHQGRGPLDSLTFAELLERALENKDKEREGAGKGKQPETVEFHAFEQADLPRCPHSVAKVVRTLGPRALLDVFAVALGEGKLLFHSRALNWTVHTTAFTEVINTLLYPLKWAHVCVPVVPAPLVDLVEAPVPFMLGVDSNWLPCLPKRCLADVLLVDCDTGCLVYGSTLQAMSSALDMAAYSGYWNNNNSGVNLTSKDTPGFRSVRGY